MGPQYEGLLILGGRMVTNLDVGSSQKAHYPETREYTLHYVKGMLGDRAFWVCCGPPVHGNMYIHTPGYTMFTFPS